MDIVSSQYATEHAPYPLHQFPLMEQEDSQGSWSQTPIKKPTVQYPIARLELTLLSKLSTSRTGPASRFLPAEF